MLQGLATSRRLRRALVMLLVAVLAAWLPMPRPLVEAWYANGLFPRIQNILTPAANMVPFALFDLLIVIIVGWWVVTAVRDLRGQRWRGLGTIVVRTVTVLAAAYVIFLLTWGLNYRRVPLADKLAVDRDQISPARAAELARLTVSRVNALYVDAHASGWAEPRVVDPELATAFARAQADLRISRRAVPGRPKYTLFDVYFQRAAVSGMTDPYFLETFVSSDLLPFERPFVTAHEWSHLAGVAEEGDANFLGWLTCLRGGASHQYSGWMFLYGEAIDVLTPDTTRSVMSALEAGPRADLAALRERYLAHVSPVVQTAGWRVYDQYLKANQVERGAASYGDVLRLVLGTRFTGDWVPTLR